MVDALSKPKNDVRGDPRTHELCSNALATKLKLEHHFKNIRQREAEFRRAKLLNLDKEARAKELLTAGQAAAPLARNAPSSPSASRSPPLQASRGDTGHLARAWSSPCGIGSQPGRYAPGASMHRFAAAVPTSHHPAVHPGALGLRSPFSSSSGGMARSASAHGSSMIEEGQLRGDGSTFMPKRTLAFASHQGDLDDEPIFGADAHGPGSQHQRLGESPKTIAKLGELMALLGPRYKTVARDKLWAQAANNETPLQRRLRVRGLASEEFGTSSAGVRPSMRDSPEDPDGKPRAAWLAARSEAASSGPRSSG